MNIVFIGAGRITNWFIDDINNTSVKDKINLFGIMNITIKESLEYQEKFKIVHVFKDINELLNYKNEIDLVYIGTSDATHYDIAKPLLEAGLNVYSEKPIALTRDKVKELYDIAREKNVLLFDGIKTGFSPAYRFLKETIADGTLGEIKYVQTSHMKVSTKGIVPNPTKEMNNFVGVHMAGGMYPMFLALDILGEPTKVHSFNERYNNEHHAISTSVMNMRFKNGGVATVLISDSITDNTEAKIIGTKGYALLGGQVEKYNEDYKKDSCHMAYTCRVFDHNSNLISLFDEKLKTDAEGLNFEIEHIYHLWQSGEKFSDIVTPEISTNIMKILELTNKVIDEEVINLEGEK